MKLVIIGASGNVGTALLRLLRAQGGHTVIGIARRRPPTADPYDVARWVSADLASDGAVGHLTHAFTDADAVINLAWGFQPARDVAYLEAVGPGGLRHVLAALRQTPVPQLVQMSSVGAYSAGRYGIPVDESWPTEGIPTLAYSRHKAAAEVLLDEFEAENSGVVVSRPRPGLVLNPEAGSSLLRYALPAIVPSRAVGWLPVLPLDRSFTVPVVHATDVAAALLAIVQQRAGGAFNLAAPTPLTRDLLAAALKARPVHLPREVLRAVLGAAWAAHLERLDPGWIDLAFAVPLISTTRARTELGWAPEHDTPAAISALVAGMTAGAGTDGPVLRRRSPLAELLDLRHGPVTHRRLP